MSITKITLENLSEGVQQNVPFTFGQVFAKGDMPADMGLEGLQVDAKAFHEDGSVRHAVISGLLDLPVGERVVELTPVSAVARSIPQAASVSASVQIVLDGETYAAEHSPTGTKWLDGHVVTEIHSASPLVRADGATHPHLHVRFAVRSYHFTGKARVDVTVENNWAYEPSPQNFTYDVTVRVGGVEVYAAEALTHLHHARWRKVFWDGAEPTVHIRHDTAYLIASRAVPNYDQSLAVPESTFAEWQKKWDKSGKGPMQVGLSVKGMSTTGGRPDIGILPQWAVLWLLTGDKGFAEMTLGTADSAGSWSMHYRDKDTDRPISLLDYPYMTIMGNPGDTGNPARIDPETKKPTREAFPTLVKGTKTPYSHDASHQPGFTYLPYLLMGDYYYLEELQFWTMWNLFQSNPGYRKNTGLWSGQVRGIAWNLRSLAQAAYITPDDDSLKGHFLKLVGDTMELGNNLFANNPDANPMGVFTGNGAVVYMGKTAVGTFQDEFLTAALGHMVELGFNEALPMLEWKARFPVERLVGDGANWLAAATYAFPVARNDGTPIHTAKEAWEVLHESLKSSSDSADAIALTRYTSGGIDMGGYPTSTEGFPANMQPAVAYAAVLSEKGKEAWKKFQSRDPKPNYGTGPQFAILPRFGVVEPPKEEPVPVTPPPVQIPPVVVPPVIVQPEMPIPVDPTPEPVEDFKPSLEDVVSVQRGDKIYEVQISTLLGLVEESLTHKFPILVGNRCAVEIAGMLSFAKVGHEL